MGAFCAHAKIKMCLDQTEKVVLDRKSFNRAGAPIESCLSNFQQWEFSYHSYAKGQM